MGTRAAIAIGLVLYVVLTTGVSFFWMSRVRKPTDYLVAGRGLPYWVLTGTIIGTCIGTGVIIGGTGLAYQHGWGGCAYPIGLGLGTLLAGLFFAQMRRFKFMTLSEEVACYYDGNRVVVEFSNISLFVSQLCWLTVQIKGGAAVVEAVTGLPHGECTVLAGLAKAAISIPGGLKAVVYTDVLQTLILFCGFGCLINSALSDSGGLAGLRQAVPADYFSFLGVASLGTWNVLGLIVVLALNPLADPGRRLTMYSAHTEAGAKWSMVTSGVIVIIFSVAVGITGMYTFHLNPGLRNPDEALPWLVMNVLPPWLAAFVVVAVVSGMSSAANGNAAAAGTFFVRHIYPLATGHYPKRPVVVARRALACAFVLSTALALYTGSIVGFVVKFLPLTMSGLGVAILLGRFWQRATWQGALAALVTTPAVSLLVMAIPSQAKMWGNPTIPAAVVGLLAQVVVSALTPQRQRGFEEVAQAMKRERQAIEGELPEELAVPAGPHDAGQLHSNPK
ncbi:MAG TPA: sodium:solute symporter family protein [Candidatus Binatia bacterium]|jgi:SSS family solute:Na+ symporter|nr:sodium:solute symporter family protein [Candidatus Binatia bacterium]